MTYGAFGSTSKRTAGCKSFSGKRGAVANSVPEDKKGLKNCLKLESFREDVKTNNLESSQEAKLL